MKKNTGILSWRACNGSNATKVPTKPFGIPATEHEGEKLQPTRSAPLESILRCELSPSPTQKAILDSLFAGPLLLKELLLKSDRRPRGPQDASLFLLQHYRELQPYLSVNGRSKSVELLKQLILQWATRIPKLIELQFSGDCSISALDQVFLPIPRLGTVTVRNEIELSEKRQGMRYRPTFALIHSTHGYLVEIVFIPRCNRTPFARPARKAGKPCPGGPQRRPRATDRIPFDQFVLLFDDHLNQRLMNDIRIARNFVSPDFDALEGKEVLGGLPSLGKRR